MQIFDYLSIDFDANAKGINHSTASFVYASVFFMAQFLVPRASMHSIINPVSVKLIGFSLITGFVYFLTINQPESSYMAQLQLETKSDKLIVKRDDIVFVLFSACCFAIYIILVALQIPVMTVDEKISAGIPILFLGIWNGYMVYLDIIGGLIPIILTLAILVIALAFTKVQGMKLNGLPQFLATSVIITFGISILDYLLSKSENLEDGQRISLMPFIIGPIIT